MKSAAIVAILVISVSCSAHKEIKEKTTSEAEDTPANVCRLINDTSSRCYEKGISITPIVKLINTKILEGESLLGQAYYPTEYYNRLARRYSLKYKTALYISTIIAPIVAQSANQDTVSFAIKPDSLTVIKKGKLIDEYELTVRLRSNFSNSVSACDTNGRATTVRFFVKKQ